MIWVLVAIKIATTTQVDAYEIGRFDSMINCFYMRQEVLVSLEAYNGIPPINTQYICVPTNTK